MKDYTTKLTLRKDCLDMLDTAMQNRGAEYGILVSKRKSALPGEVGMFQAYGNRLIVALTADDSEDALIEEELLVIAVKWARLRLREQTGGINPATIIEKMNDVELQFKRFQSIRKKCTGINTITKDIDEELGKIEKGIKASLTAISDSLNATTTKKEPATTT